MDNHSLAIYVHELRNLLFNIQGSFNLFNTSMTQQQSGGILYSGQLVLNPVSQLAALLWPTRARSRARGEKLREILQLPEKHMLNDRRLIEIMERNDERMDEWISQTKGERVVVDFVGDIAQLGPDMKVEGIYRAYDPKTLVFYYRGVGFNLKGIADHVQNLAQRINAVYAQMFPEQIQREREYIEQVQAAQKAQAEQQAQPGDVTPTAESGGEASKQPAQDAAESDQGAKGAPAKKQAPAKAPAKTKAKAAPRSKSKAKAKTADA